MFIQKKPKWNIFCRIRNGSPVSIEKDFELSFTTNDYQKFVPPNGAVVNFNFQAELGRNYPKLKLGIYTNSHASCLVSETSNGLCLQGYSNNWAMLSEYLSKILSSASAQPKILHTADTPLQQVVKEWTQAMISLFPH